MTERVKTFYGFAGRSEGGVPFIGHVSNMTVLCLYLASLIRIGSTLCLRIEPD